MRLTRSEQKLIARLEGIGICSGGKGGTPPPPDYAGAAQAQGAANVETAKVQGRLSNPNITTPLGGRRVTFNPDDTVNVNEYLTPEGQARFDQEQRIIRQIGNVAESGVDRVGQAVATPFDASKLPALMGVPTADAETRKRVEQSLIDRQQPYLARARAATETQLSNQGIMRGSEAWKNAQDDLARSENDATLAAIGQGGAEEARQFGMALQSGQFGNQARQQSMQEQAWLRQLPLNELNALRTGSQVGIPQFQAFQGTQGIQAPDLMGATQAGYDAQVGTNNAKNAARGQTAATAGTLALGAMMMF